MGYTHYWKFNQEPTLEKFTEFVEGVNGPVQPYETVLGSTPL